MEKIREVSRTRDGVPYKFYRFWCPGCEEYHRYDVNVPGGPNWEFNGNFEQPSFTPSLLYPSETRQCHLYVTDGKIIYQGDCFHALAGKTVDMEEYSDISEA